MNYLSASLLAIIFVFSFTVYSQSIESKSDWKQYSSAMAGFSIKYPLDWKIEEEEAKGQIWRLSLISPGVRDDDVWEAATMMICSKPKGASFENLDRCADHHLHIAKHRVVFLNTFFMNGIEMRRFETEDTFSPSRSYLTFFFSTKDRDFIVNGDFSRTFKMDRYIPVFDEIVKTFQPLEEKSVLTFKNEKYDFALTYPVSWKSCPIKEINNNADAELLLRIVPTNESCSGNNYISAVRMTKLSNEKNNLDLRGFLNEKDFTKTIPYIEFGNIHASIGEKVTEDHIYRERYFYTNYPTTYELLRISEMYQLNNEVYQKEAKEILMTARRFLKNQ